MAELAILILSVVFSLSIGFFVVLRNPRQPVNQVYGLLTFSFVGISIANYPTLSFSNYTLPSMRAVIFFTTVCVTAIYFLVKLIQSDHPRILGQKINQYVLALSIVIASLDITPLVFSRLENGTDKPVPVPEIGVLFFVLHFITIVTMSLVYLFKGIRRGKGAERSQYLYILAGLMPVLILAPVTSIIFPVLLHRPEFVFLSPLYTAFFVAMVAYAMIRHHLFDIRLLIARFMAYLLMLLFAGGLYGLAIVALSFLVTGVQPSFVQTLVSTTIVGVLILFVQPLKVFFNRITSAIFYQDAYDTKDVLDKLASVLVRSTDTNILAHSSMTILKDVLKSEHMTMLLLDGTMKDGQRFIGVGKRKSELSHDFSAKLLSNVPGILVADTLENRSDHLRTKMQSGNIAAIARLETRGGVIGYCFFGYKTSGSSYSQRDIDLIRIACDELAVAIQNALRFEQIQDFNNTLQQRIEDATKELRASNNQLQRLDESKDEFLSMASHQLRTPLTSVKGYLSMVLEGDVGKVTATQRQLLGEAFTSSERMVHLINDFLNVSRLQTGKFMLEKRPVDLPKIITQEVESLQTTAKAHDLKLHFRAPSYFPTLYLDEGKIRQVLMNFIDNAIYYSPEAATITVTLSVEEGYAILQVHDTGIGVPKSEQAHLFTKFFRATNARKQRPDGTGVGLFLAKMVVVAHGGSILFESIENEGSTFGFRLPIKKLSAVPGKHADKLDN